MRQMLGLLLLATAETSSAQSPPAPVSSGPAIPAIPSPLTSVYTPEFIPMTQAERLRHFLKTTFSPEAVILNATSAGLNQWHDSPEEWRQDGAGYGKRFANGYARSIVRQTMVFGISSALHEDNRYFRSGQTSFGPRLKYALLLSTILARRDDGTRRLSVSRLGGTAGAAFVSNAWQPPGSNGTGDAWTNFSISMGAQTAFNVAREFLPRRLSRSEKE